MLKILNYTLFFIVLLFACKNPEKEKATLLEKEVMAIHDEIMPKMSEIDALKKQLQAAKVGRDTVVINEKIAQLEAAGESMWSWMHAYKAPDANATSENVVGYLEAEKVKIREVKTKMLTSIEQGRMILEQK